MGMKSKARRMAKVSLTALALGVSWGSAWAQSADEEDVVVVTGVRGAGRTVLDSPVPIDVLSAESIGQVSFTDTNDILRTLVPSFSVQREPISDGATFIRPATLRGLPGDKTLLLVNSHRRHRAALVEIGGAGSQSPDAATIPSAAIERVEVLRDGAAAQYGSDAIAGVINFILKDDAEGGSLTLRAGEYYEGDGEEYTLSGNVGMPLTDSGFVNVAFEYTSAQPTSRGEQYCNNGPTAASRFCALPNLPEEYIAAGGRPAVDQAYIDAHPEYFALVRNPAQNWGQPQLEAFRTFVNTGLDVGGVHFYAFGSYSYSDAVEEFNYRPPTNSINGTVLTTPNGDFSFNEIFRAGFTPIFYGAVTDYSLTAGGSGDMVLGISYDLSARFGHSDVDYSIDHTVNPSLGPASPTEFYLSNLANEEFSLNADFLKDIDTGFLAGPLTFAFGAEYLREKYISKPGEEASYIAGPYAASNGMPVGANGFPGTPPDYAGSITRESYGFYAEASADVFESLFVDAAVRYEHYSDFGETTDGKIAARYAITPSLGFRASVSTGFRAPTPGQLGTTNVSTRVTDGVVIASGLFPASNPVSQFLGAEELGPEESTNYSAGVTWTLGDFDLSLDFYQIEITDQFYASSPQTVTPQIRAELIAANVPGANSIGQVVFFQNAFDSTTSGIDLVGSYGFDWVGGSSRIIASLNYNEYEIDQVNIGGLLNAEDIFDFENGLPQWRGTVTATDEVGPFLFLARANIYGPYKNTLNSSLAATQEFDTKVLFDLEASYQVNDTYRLTVGARNVFDEYPAPDSIGELGNGAIYRPDSVVDWQGGFYYVQAQATF